MKSLLEKLNYKGQKRIVVIGAEKNFRLAPLREIKDVQIDSSIDPRYPYDFMIIFAKSVSEVDAIAPMTIHNLAENGILWFCYPKKTSKMYSADIDRDHGWKALNDVDFYGIRLVSVDNDWSAMRFRNIKYIKATSERFKIKNVK